MERIAKQRTMLSHRVQQRRPSILQRVAKINLRYGAELMEEGKITYNYDPISQVTAHLC